MATELRCEGNLFGLISDDGTSIEVKCKRRKCGHAPGTVVIHTLSLSTGQVIKTNIYRNPPREE